MKQKKTSTKRSPRTFAPATATPEDPRLTAALAEITRLKDEARQIREAAVKHETALERVWKWIGGSSS